MNFGTLLIQVGLNFVVFAVGACLGYLLAGKDAAVSKPARRESVGSMAFCGPVGTVSHVSVAESPVAFTIREYATRRRVTPASANSFLWNLAKRQRVKIVGRRDNGHGRGRAMNVYAWTAPEDVALWSGGGCPR